MRTHKHKTYLEFEVLERQCALASGAAKTKLVPSAITLLERFNGVGGLAAHIALLSNHLCCANE